MATSIEVRLAIKTQTDAITLAKQTLSDAAKAKRDAETKLAALKDQLIDAMLSEAEAANKKPQK